MIVGNRGSLLNLVRWQYRAVLLFTAVAATVVALRELAGLRWLRVPTVTAAVIGGALGIFVSFRTNAAYARWWEGRGLWGRVVNASRTFATQSLAYLPAGDGGAPSELQRRLVRRLVLYVHVLRCALRDQDPWKDPEVARFSTEDERVALATESNAPHAILHAQLVDLAAARDAGALTDLRLDALDRTIATLLDAQGGCERIKRTPMPKGYGFFADQLIRAFGLVFPLAIADDLRLAAVPLNVLVCLGFLMISEVGRVLEDPFTMFWNGLPLSAITRTIENNVRQRLGDKDLLPAITADANGILM